MNKLYTKAPCGKFFSFFVLPQARRLALTNEKHTGRCHGEKVRILGENAFKMRICRQMSRKKLDKMGKSSLKRLVFVYIAFLVAKKT